MERRNFLRTSFAASTAAVITPLNGIAPAQTNPAQRAGNRATFKLRYAPHFDMFKHSAGEDLIDQLKFAADQGFTAFEDNAMAGRTVEVQEKIAREMARLNMELGIFVADWDGLSKSLLPSGDKALRESFLKKIQGATEIAKRVNTKYMTLVIGNAAPKLHEGYQNANVIDALRRACEICEKTGLVMVGEPLNIYRDHPGFFVHTNAHMYALVKAVNSPSFKVLFDIYHTQINEGNIIPNIDACYDEIAYMQTGDHPGRNEPTTGEINYKNVFKHIHAKGYKGILGMEHGISKPGKAGEQALIAAYREVDSFMA